MATLNNFTVLGGKSPQLSTIAQILSHQGVEAPHNGSPYSEALLFGISGGAAFGYFIFDYQGQDPQVNILTRNTFGGYGWDSVCERLLLPQELIRSGDGSKAAVKLSETIEQGLAPAVWADVFTLGYEHSELGEQMWAMQPVTVFQAPGPGEAGEVRFADRSRAELSCSAELFDNARGKIKKDRFLMITLDAPAAASVGDAVLAGIRDSISLFFEKPPKGSANNFGYKAMTRLAKDLSDEKGKSSWTQQFPDDRRRLAAMMSMYKYSLLHWKDESLQGDRGLFADFLDEAAEILAEKKISEVADEYRNIAGLWKDLAGFILPETIGACAKAAEVLKKRHGLFLSDGTAAQSELETLDREYGAILDDASLGAPEALGEAHKELAAAILTIRDREEAGLRSLAGIIDYPGLS